jgi:predicted DNA binding CopG/RHH family protein
MAQKVAISTTSAPRNQELTNSRNTRAMKRLTIDIPASLHSRVKVACAQRGVKMADEIRELLEAHFAK